MKFKVLGICLFIVLLSGCSAPSHTARNSDSHGVMSANQNVTTIQQTSLSTVDISKVASFDKLRSSTEGLFRLGKNGHVNLGLAKRYTISKNAKVYEFKLRRNAKWSNGQPITASDFVYSWRRTVDAKTGSVNANLFAGIKNATLIHQGKLPSSQLGVKALNQHTLKVTLAHPMTYLTTLLAYPLFAPQSQATVSKFGSQYGASAKSQIYSGPFKLVKWHTGSTSRTLVPNPYYWDKAHVYLRKLTITTAKSPAADLKAYEAGHTDEIQLVGSQIANNKHRDDYDVRPFSLMRYISYNFNTSNHAKKRLLNNRDVRLAISHAINRRALINAGPKNASLVPKGFVTAGLSKNNRTGSDFADVQQAQSNVKVNAPLAKRQWQTAKKTLGQSHYQLTLLTPEDPISQPIAQNIKRQLEKKLAGLTITIKQVPQSKFYDQADQGKFDLLLSGWSADYPDPLAFLQLMASTTHYNYGKWHNHDYDKLINQIMTSQTPNAELRWQQMLRAEKILTTDQAVTPLFQQANSYLTNPKLVGVVHNYVGVLSDFKSAYLVK